MKWIIHKLRRPHNDTPWIAYSAHLASSFDTFEAAITFADRNTVSEPTS